MAGRRQGGHQPDPRLRGGQRVLRPWGDDRNDGWGEYPEPGSSRRSEIPPPRGHYEYGSRAGVWRLARIYDAASVPVTISGSAVALELTPRSATGSASTITTFSATAGAGSRRGTRRVREEREYLRRAIETYKRVLGSRPVGWNCRSWPSENTRDLLVEEGGFIYDSDVCADDLPYYDRRPASRGWSFRTRRPITTRASRPIPASRARAIVLDTLTMGLDLLVHEDRPVMMTVPVHARWSGQAGRAAAAEGVHRLRQAPAGRRLHAPRGHRPLVARELPGAVVNPPCASST